MRMVNALPGHMFALVLGTWTSLAGPTLLLGPQVAPCTFGVLMLVLVLTVASCLCDLSSLDPGGERMSEKALRALLFCVVLVLVDFGDAWALEGTLAVGSGAKRSELFMYNNCVLCAVLEDDEHFRAFDVLLGASLPVTLLVVQPARRSGQSSSSFVGGRFDAQFLLTSTKAWALTWACWALAVAIQSSCYSYNFVAGRPHNLDRMVLLGLGILVCKRRGFAWALVPWSMVMTGQFSMDLWTDTGWKSCVGNWGILWQLLTALCGWELVQFFFPGIGPQPVEAAVRFLIGTHYITPWAHKVMSKWLKDNDAAQLWHFLASGAFVHGTDQAWGSLTQAFFRMLIAWTRSCDQSMIAVAVLYSQVLCGFGIALCPGWPACLCALLQASFHVVIAFSAGHVLWGHFLACFGLAFCEGLRAIPENIASNWRAKQHVQTGPRLAWGVQVLAFLFYNASTFGDLLRWHLDEGRLASIDGSTWLRAMSEQWPFMAYRDLHPAIPTMAFLTSPAAFVWRVRVLSNTGEKVELDANAFSPFALPFARADPSFLHESMWPLPWMQGGECGSNHFVRVGAQFAALDCKRTLNLRETQMELQMPLGMARCFPRFAEEPSDEGHAKAAALGRFELILGRLLLHLESGCAGSAALWSPFRLADWLHQTGWLHRVPKDPMCCYGSRRGMTTRAMSVWLTDSIGPGRVISGVEVQLEEAYVCEDAAMPDGYWHVPSFSGIIYQADRRGGTQDESADTPRKCGRERGIQFDRREAPELDTEWRMCQDFMNLMSSVEQRHRQENPGCWDKGFSPYVCCDLQFGPTGKEECWDESASFVRCCTDPL